MKFNDILMMTVDRDIKTGRIPMLLGEPGIGKSSWVEALAQRNSTQVFVLACNQLADKADLTGARLVPIDDKGNYKQVFFPHSTIMDAIMYAKDHPHEQPILFMDELNRTTPDVTSACLSIPTQRKIGDVSLPSNLRLIIAGNDKGNITSLDEASVSRFVLYHVCPDTETFLGLDQNLNPFVEKVLRAHPETIFCKTVRITTGATTGGDDDDEGEVDIDSIVDDAEQMNQITTPRTISGVSSWLNAFSNAELVTLLSDTHTVDGVEVSALQECLEGHTGRTAFTTFLLAEIASGVSTINNQTNAINVVKPQRYDQMKACPDVTSLNTFIQNMNDTEKAACLVYAMYERVDNSTYIRALALATPMLDSANVRLLMQLSTRDMLDEANKDALLNTQCTLTNTLSIILNT